MSTKTKKKLCWNCEGSIDVKVDKCPFCGVSADVTPIPGTQPKGKSLPKASSGIPQAPYAIKEENPPENASTEASAPTSDFQAIAFSLSFLLLGTVLAIFSFVLYLFSDAQGILTLQWHASYWYIYLLIALPLLYLGWRTASTLSSAEEESL